MCQRLTVLFFGVMAILLIGTPVGQAQTVVEFTILGPRVVLDDDQNSLPCMWPQPTQIGGLYCPYPRRPSL